MEHAWKIATVVAVLIVALGCIGSDSQQQEEAHYQAGFRAGLQLAGEAYDHALDRHLRADAVERSNRPMERHLEALPIRIRTFEPGEEKPEVEVMPEAPCCVPPQLEPGDEVERTRTVETV